MKSLRLPLILLLCAAVLAMRIGGVHVHRHAEAHAAPSEIHLADVGLHDDKHHDDVAPHVDVEIQLFDNLVAKSGKTGFDGMALFAALLFVALLWRPQVQARRPLALFPFLQPVFLRPPLRGPPR